jgi:hypothetical protein
VYLSQENPPSFFANVEGDTNEFVANPNGLGEGTWYWSIVAFNGILLGNMSEVGTFTVCK